MGRLDLVSEKVTQKFKASPNDDFGIHALSLTGDQRSLVFGDSGGHVVFASLENPEAIKMVKKSRFHEGIVVNCEISKDKKHVVTSSTDHSMKVFGFEEESGLVSEGRSFHQNNGWVWGLQMLNNMSMFLAVSSDSYITVWDVKEGRLIKETENDLAESRAHQARSTPRASAARTSASGPFRPRASWPSPWRSSGSLISPPVRRRLLAQSRLQLRLQVFLHLLQLALLLLEVHPLAQVTITCIFCAWICFTSAIFCSFLSSSSSSFEQSSFSCAIWFLKVLICVISFTCFRIRRLTLEKYCFFTKFSRSRK